MAVAFLPAASSPARPTPLAARWPRLAVAAASEAPALGAAASSTGSRAARSAALTAAAAGLCCAAASVGRRSARRRCGKGHLVACRSYATGPGWTDEVARVFHPRIEGPQWNEQVGYRGRQRIRMLLDGEDLAMSYAHALQQRTGTFTGPLSAGIEKALNFSLWAGTEEPLENQPELEVYVGLPADLVESVKPGSLVDGFPEELRQEIGRVEFSETGYFVNDWIMSLQGLDRLVTWERQPKAEIGKKILSALIDNKRRPYKRPKSSILEDMTRYQPYQAYPVRDLTKHPNMLLSKVMGTAASIKVGDTVEALKAGLLIKDQWTPSSWKKAVVKTVNYDGTYDLEYIKTFGPYYDTRQKGLGRAPPLTLRKNEVYREAGADSMPARFRLMQELDYSMATPTSRIRLVGSLERLSDTSDNEAAQDWFLCSTKRFFLTYSATMREARRLSTFAGQFQLGFEWVDGDEGLQFKPVPNAAMAAALRVNHKDIAVNYKIPTDDKDPDRLTLDRYKANMAGIESQVEQIPKVPDAMPTEPAGPRGRGRILEKPMPFLKSKADAAGMLEASKLELQPRGQ